MEENVLIIEKFKKSFSGKEHQKFVLYGLGQNSRTILEHFSEFSFLGLMDGFREDGLCFGYPILSEARVAELHPDAIIIVARKNSTRIIAKRIEGFCREIGIALYDLDGQDMLATESAVEIHHPYFQKNAEELWVAIESHDVVSFDIFDTLLMRRVLYPEDVFALLEQTSGIENFSKARQEAERRLYREGGQPTLRDIYREVQKALLLDEVKVGELYHQEIETEKKVLIPRKDMVGLMKRAVDEGKTVWLISDMYYPADMLREFLSNCGVDGFHKIFVSCDYGEGKTQGLYRMIQKETGVDSWLHIGDSPEADEVAALTAGLDVVMIKCALEMVEISTWDYLLRLQLNLAERTVLGGILAEGFNSPFALYQSEGRAEIRKAFELGRIIFAPVLMGVFFWVMDKCTGVNNVILWGARDGYLFYRMHRIYQKYIQQKKLPRPIYFYTSRMAAMAGYPTCREDIIYMAGIGFSGKPEEMLLLRFGLSRDEVLPRKEGETIEEYVLRHEAFILKKARSAREKFKKYWDSLQVSAEEKIVFFDLVSSGSCHMCAEKFIERKIDGLYLVHILEDYERKKEIHCEAYMEEDYLMQLKTYVSSNYEPLETIVMSPEPSLEGYSEEGHAVFAGEKRTEKDFEYLSKIQSGVLRAFEEFCMLWGDGKAEIRPQFAEAMYELLRKKYTRIKTRHLAEQTVTDDFTKRDFVMEDMFD